MIKLSLRRKDIKRLAVDELAVVFYLRLLFNVALAGLVGLAVMRLADILWNDALEGHRFMFFLAVSLTVYLAWTLHTLFVIRQELRQRDHQTITHTPTFYSWAKATHVVAAFSLLHPFFDTWLAAKPFETAAAFAWVSSCLMAGFYLVYFLFLMLLWRRPPWSIMVAFLLALTAAMLPPSYSRH